MRPAELMRVEDRVHGLRQRHMPELQQLDSASDLFLAQEQR